VDFVGLRHIIVSQCTVQKTKIYDYKCH